MVPAKVCSARSESDDDVRVRTAPKPSERPSGLHDVGDQDPHDEGGLEALAKTDEVVGEHRAGVLPRDRPASVQVRVT
jgi:hypothetical protein